MSGLTKELAWLYDLQRFGSKLELDRIEKIMSLFDNPQNNMKSIHIAGTNGKGSTAAMIASCLRASGYKTGLYTSPHLICFNERINVDDKDISDKEAIELINKIKEMVEKNDLQLTFFEFVTAMAFLYFNNMGVEYAVIEVGCGGRFDATNIINPVISAITNIDIDHEHILGNSKIKIAKEKAGVIKKGNPLVSGVSEVDEDVNEYIAALCEEKECELIRADSVIEKEISDNYEIGLRGKHQIKNASVALLVLRKLGIDDSFIHGGLKNVEWPGRIDIREWKGKKVIIDSAHNSAGMACFAEYLRNIDSNKTVILGFSETKNIEEMANVLKNVLNENDKIYITKSDFNPADISYVRDIIEKIFDKNITIETFENAIDAVDKALNNNLIIITGSIYLLGKILQQEIHFK